ncbi:hypothetical protein NGA35_03975 [Pseudomonas stutzeri]|nr:hypothetical protein [Stutzerimonas stutzeri]
MKSIQKLLVFLSVALIPIYLWDSGGVQISHIILAAFCATCMISTSITPNLPERIILAICLIILARESADVFAGGDIRLLMPFAYMTFNLLILISVRHWLEEDDNIEVLKLALLTALAVATAGVLMVGYKLTVDSDGGRAIGTFNNPNQLGYFSVCCFSLATLLYIKSRLSLTTLLVAISACYFLAIASLSKAAMVGIAFSTILLLTTIGSQEKSALKIATVIFGISGLLIYFAVNDGIQNYAFVDRISRIGSDNDDSLAGRGYGVITEMDGLRFLTGFGTEAIIRFFGNEVHSTVGGIFIGYGVIAGALILAFIFLWCKKLSSEFGLIGAATILAPPLLYGLTHNGIRFTIFWITLALSFSLSRHIGNEFGNYSHGASHS